LGTVSRTDSCHGTEPAARDVLQPEEPRGTIYVDLTGRFPHISARGNEYLMCRRCSDSNYIHVEPLRSRNTKEFTSAFERTIKFFRDREIHHVKAKMNNEVSNVFKETAKNLGITIEFVFRREQERQYEV
jgi:hypothetical protein